MLDKLLDKKLDVVLSNRTLMEQAAKEKTQTPQKCDGQGNQGNLCRTKITNITKSPSDTMIYVPALAKSPVIAGNSVFQNKIGQNARKHGSNPVSSNNDVMNKISNFIEGIRFQQHGCQQYNHKINKELYHCSKIRRKLVAVVMMSL